MTILTSNWMKAAGVRAMKTVAQTAVAIMSTSTLIEAVDWKTVVSATVLAGLLSILTSIGGLPEIDEKTGENK